MDDARALRVHQSPPHKSSTKSVITLPGPCTPTVSTRSISAVRLGPVTSVENARPLPGELSDHRRRVVEGSDQRGGGADRGLGQRQHPDRSVFERRF